MEQYVNKLTSKNFVYLFNISQPQYKYCIKGILVSVTFWLGHYQICIVLIFGCVTYR